MNPQRKITVHVPEDLLRRALESSGKGLTFTVREGLQLVAAGKAYQSDILNIKTRASSPATLKGSTDPASRSV